MNVTKPLVTGAVALTAFASVLGLAYAQVENSTESTQPQTQEQQYPATQTDPAQQAAPAEQSMTPADQSQQQSTDPQSQSQTQPQQTQPEAQSQQAQPQSSDQWQSQQGQQSQLPSEPTSAGTPAPRADRN